VVARHLTGEADAGKTAGGEDGFFRLGHARRLAADEFHAARRAARVPAAGVHLIDLRVLLEREDEALPLGHLERPDVLNREPGHQASLEVNRASAASMLARMFSASDVIVKLRSQHREGR
jgi:hypothetical protein